MLAPKSPNSITVRCLNAYCGRFYPIVFVFKKTRDKNDIKKDRKIFDLLLDSSCCPWCHKPRDPEVYEITNAMPRCNVCGLPSQKLKRGMCIRDYFIWRRTVAKDPAVIV
jgi:hypothetical protein